MRQKFADIMYEFHELSKHDQIEALPEFCIRLGCLNKEYTKPKFFDKMNEKEFDEISDSESESETGFTVLSLVY